MIGDVLPPLAGLSRRSEALLPRLVLTPRAVSARAMPRRVVTPLAWISRMIGATLAAKASASWARASREARRAFRAIGALAGLYLSVLRGQLPGAAIEPPRDGGAGRRGLSPTAPACRC